MENVTLKQNKIKEGATENEVNERIPKLVDYIIA